MNKDVINKLDEIESLISNDKDFIELKKLKKEILNDKELVSKISKLKTIDKYDSSYLDLKKEILNNSKYKRFISLENELYLTIQQINKKLNSLKENGGCR